MWFYYPVLTYIITGFSVEPEIINSIQNINDEQRQIIESSRNGWGYEFAE